MRNLAPIYWHEGLFLRPHHLQQMDRYQADRLGIHLEYLNRFHHGVASLEIEAGALKNRTFEVSRGAFVFPSGEVALVPENAGISPRSLEGHLPPAGQPLEVFLGLPRVKPNAPNFKEDDDTDGAVTRYRVRTRVIPDETSGESPASIGFGVANVHVLYGSEDRGSFECLKIAEIIQSGPDTFDLSPRFIPPCLRIDAHPGIQQLCKRVQSGLLGKSRTLQEQKKDRSDPALQIQLLAVNSYVALVNHLMATGNIHPFHFYGVLCQIAGALSCFAPGADAGDLMPYSHDAPGASYQKVADNIDEYLQYIGPPTKFAEVRLAWSGAENHYAGDFEKELFAEGSTYYLCFAGAEDVSKIRAEVDSGGTRIGAPSRIAVLERQFLRGVILEPLPGSPEDLPKREGAFYRVRSMGPEWDLVRESGKIAVHMPSMRDLTISVFVVKS